MTRQQLTATRRSVKGSRGVKRLSRDGLITGVVYGKQTEPIPIMMDRRAFTKFLRAWAIEHGLLNLRIESDGAPWEKPVLIKQLQHDPVKGEIIHIDFHAIALTEQIRVKVPIVLIGVPVGVKQDGGILEHFLREIEVECLPTQIPKHVEHEVSQLKIGENVHVSDLTAPVGSRITADPASVVVSVLAPKEEKPEEAEAAVTEPEVIREKKPEADEATAEGKEEKAKKEEKVKEEKEKK